MSVLKLRVDDMHSHEKNCCLVFDEMSLKQHIFYDRHSGTVLGIEGGKPVNQALVLMVRGISTKWKQPFGYFLGHGSVTSAELSKIVREGVLKLDKIGLNVRALICDQSATNIASLRKLGFSLDPYKPHIQIPSHESIVHIIFDPPHLIKNVRNNLIRHDIEVDGEIVSWKHIQSFYDMDNRNPVRMAPKLTDQHLDPGPLLAMKVKLATQVFSHQVSSALKVCLEQQMMSQDASPTADFVEKMDKCFDLMNSRKLFADKPARCALTASGQNLEDLEEMKKWIEKWRFIGVKNPKSIPSHWGLSVAIDSILSLSRELLAIGFQFVCTSRFNQDCIENFFSIIRSKGGWNDRPSAVQFCSAYQNALLLLSVEKSKSNSNCLDDEDVGLAISLTTNISNKENSCESSINLANSTISEIQPRISNKACTEVSVGIVPVECQSEEVYSESVEQVLTYIAGWLVRKVCICDACKSTLSCIESQSSSWSIH